MGEKRKTKSNTSKKKNPVSKDKKVQESNKQLKKDMKQMNTKNKKKVGKIILIVFLVIILISVITAGVLIGMIFSEFGEDWKMSKKDLVMGETNTKVYDAEGNLLATLSGDETRQPVTLDEMSEFLPKAYVAIEDERFYEHSGIDIKRTLGAIIKYITGDSSYGGSSITQQVVKNLTKDDERAIERKIKEWGRAYNVEQILSKQQILQLYLNLIYVGGPMGQGLHGVEMGAIYYFNKSAKDLSLAECAFLAGINSSPSAYNPFQDLDEEGNMPTKMKEKIDKKVRTVLAKMKELGPQHEAGISEEDYNYAISEVEEGLKFEKGSTTMGILSHHTELALDEVIQDYMEKKECTRDFAKNYIFSSGLEIHTTQVPYIQQAIEKEYKEDIKVITSKITQDDEGNYVTSQSAMAIMDHTTGQVVGCVGGIGEKTTNWDLNRVKTTRSNGSSMKPLAVIVPGLEEGLITAASVYDDYPFEIGNAKVRNYSGCGYWGLSTVRFAIEISLNTVPVRIITQLTPSKSLDYLEKMGITTLRRDVTDGRSDNGHSLALGGLTDGVSVLEIAGAYSTIANSGVYIEPTFYTKVVDSSTGETILETSQESHRVLSEANAYIAKSILTQPVVGSNGTASRCKVKGIETCAKTGTTDDNKDRWLCGFTPYYTAAIWYGFDQPESLNAIGYNPGSYTFGRVMNSIHQELPDANFEMPENIIKVAVCKSSGLLPGEHCNDTVDGNKIYTELFVKGTEPKKTCDIHVTAKACLDETHDNVYILANENCTNVHDFTFITRPNVNENDKWREAADAKFMLPTAVCTKHKEAPDKEAPVLTLKGKEKITLKVGEKFKDEGATAVDKKDGDLTSKIVVTGKVDTSKKGTYTLTYTVEDKAKNKATKTRTVVVEEKETPTNNVNTNTTNPGGNTTTDKPNNNTTEKPNTNTVEKPNDNNVNPDENKTKSVSNKL